MLIRSRCSSIVVVYFPWNELLKIEFLAFKSFIVNGLTFHAFYRALIHNCKSLIQTFEVDQFLTESTYHPS